MQYPADRRRQIMKQLAKQTGRCRMEQRQMVRRLNHGSRERG